MGVYAVASPQPQETERRKGFRLSGAAILYASIYTLLDLGLILRYIK